MSRPLPKPITNADEALALMTREEFRLICYPGLGVYTLRPPLQHGPIRLGHAVADTMLELGLVSLVPEESEDELVFLPTAEGFRRDRAAAAVLSPHDIGLLRIADEKSS
jgi:hypothetical protein